MNAQPQRRALADDSLAFLAGVRLVRRPKVAMAWDESEHPRGKTSDESTPGSFAPTRAGRLMAQAIAEGGFTYQPVADQFAPAQGFALSTDVGNEVPVPIDEVTAQTFADYINAHADVFDDPTKFLGVWIDHDSGKVVFDVSTVVRDRDEAIRLAAKFKQEAIYDLEKGETVPVRAQGEQRRFVESSPHSLTIESAHHDPGADGRGATSRREKGLVDPTTLMKAPRQKAKRFTSAVARTDFPVIEQRTDALAEAAVENISDLVARAVKRAISDDDKLTDLADIGHLKIESADVGKIKAACADMLARAYLLGYETVRDEMVRAKHVKMSARRLDFATIKDRAAAYLEANSFRMAGNITDGLRALIQQELLAAVRGEVPVAVVRSRIYARLIRKGFLAMRSLLKHETREEVTAAVEQALGEAFGVGSKAIPHYLDTLVRTNLFEALSEARWAEFNDPDLGDFIVAFEYQAILDNVTTDICRECDGMVFAKDNPIWNEYRPPNHYNCRSVLTAINVTDEWDGREGTRTGKRRPTNKPQDGFGGAENE